MREIAAPPVVAVAPPPPPPAPAQDPGWGVHGPGYPPAPSPSYSAPVTSSKADAAFVLGIISILANLFYVPGILAIVWGGRERQQNSKARTGFICGIIGTSLSALWTLIIVVAIAGAGNAVDNAVNDTAGAPSTAGNTKASYNVGETAETGDFEATVLGFENPQAPASEYFTPKPGWHYVSVDVQITNPNAKDQQSFSSMLGFHLLDDQNRQYDEDFMAGLSPGPPEGEIAAGQSIRGFVAFEVPDGSTGLKLRVQGSLTAAGAVFNLA